MKQINRTLLVLVFLALDFGSAVAPTAWHASADDDPSKPRSVTGVVRDATTGQPVPGIVVFYEGTGAPTDRDGRFRREYRNAPSDDDVWVWVLADQSNAPYVNALRRFRGAKEPDEIVADFDLPPAVMVTGRVVEAGTNRPLTSAPRRHCHDPVEGGPIVAGYVYYFPLSTNGALRGTPTGLYFEGLPQWPPQCLSSTIDGDGRFRLAVPPGPGILLVRADAGLLMSTEFWVWSDTEEFQRLFPYAPLTGRAENDGAPPNGDAHSLPGFARPIELATYHAYRIIDPPATAKTLEVTLSVPRGPSRVLRFIAPDGNPMRGVSGDDQSSVTVRLKPAAAVEDINLKLKPLREVDSKTGVED